MKKRIIRFMGEPTPWFIIGLYGLFWLVVLSYNLGVFDVPEDADEFGYFAVDYEACHLVDYEIHGDTITFRYEIWWENTTAYDKEIVGVDVSFHRKDLKGWLKYEHLMSGKHDNGEYSVIIPSGERCSTILVFEGTYLGGTVNEDMSGLDKIMFLRKTPATEPQTDTLPDDVAQ